MIVPRDTVANRPSSPINGMIRYASDTNKLEGYINSAWQSLGVTGNTNQTFSGDVTLSGAGTGLTVSNGTALNGTTTLGGATTVSANQNFSMASGTGQFSQSYSGTSTASTITNTGSGDLLDLISASTTAVNNDKVLNIAVSGANGTGTVTRYGVYSNVTSTGATSTNVGGYFSASGATNNYGLLVPNGNVGIGTTSPAAKLDVRGGVSYFGSNSYAKNTLGTGDLALDNGATDSPGVHFYYGTNSNFGIDSFYNGSNQGLRFTSNLDESGGVARMFLDTNGNLGIGTTTPTYLLDVNSSTSTAVRIQNPGVSVNLADSTAGAYGIKTSAAAAFGSIYLTSGGALNAFNYIPFATGAGYSERMRTDSSGNVGIGTTTPGYKLDAQGGDINASGSVRSATIALTSDIRFKKDIKNLDGSLEKILNLRGVSYNWRVDQFPERKFNDRHQIGVIAQEVEEKFPELVDTDRNGYKSVNYPALVAPLLEAVKSFYGEFRETMSRITLLETNDASKDRLIASLAVTTKILSEKVKEIDDLKAKNEKLASSGKELTEKVKEIDQLKSRNEALEKRMIEIEKALKTDKE